MSADFTSIANLINQHGSSPDRARLVTMLKEAAYRDQEVTANAAHAVTYHQANRDAFLHAVAERAANRILEQLQLRREPYNFHLVAVALRSAAGSEVDAQAPSTTR
ncbi:hypothetical protein [Streptomyces olivaceoviridis]|uniref:hypothetical protein n=1 Tax=Streptomyces olivaceoviridis TaxID=1921 RepID=UPI00332EE124